MTDTIRLAFAIVSLALIGIAVAMGIFDGPLREIAYALGSAL